MRAIEINKLNIKQVLNEQPFCSLANLTYSRKEKNCCISIHSKNAPYLEEIF